MQKKSDDFSMQEAMRMAQSDAGKQLLAYLQSKNGTQLNAAMEQAAAGDYDQVRKTMEALISSPEVKALLQRLKE